MSYRISVDTGGTFTDVVVAAPDGQTRIGKALTTIDRAFDGIRPGLGQVAEELGLTVRELLERTSHFAYGTTRATNADRGGQDGADGATSRPRAFPTSCSCARAARSDSFTAAEFPTALRPAPPDVRDLPSASTPTATVFTRSRRGARAGGDRRSAGERDVEAVAVCLLWSIVEPGPRAARRRAPRRAPAGRAGHAVARAEPDRARVPARVVDGDRRLAEAADAARTCASLERRPARRRASPAAPAHGHLRRRHARRDG